MVNESFAGFIVEAQHFPHSIYGAAANAPTFVKSPAAQARTGDFWNIVMTFKRIRFYRKYLISQVAFFSLAR